MRENLFSPIPILNPCFGSVSPVSRVNNPGFPSRAGIGVKLGDSLNEESPPDAAAGAGVGAAAGVALAGAGAGVGVAAASVVFKSAVGVATDVLAASPLGAMAFSSSALVPSAHFAVPAVNVPTKNKMAAYRRNLIVPPPLLPHSLG